MSFLVVLLLFIVGLFDQTEAALQVGRNGADFAFEGLHLASYPGRREVHRPAKICLGASPLRPMRRTALQGAAWGYGEWRTPKPATIKERSNGQTKSEIDSAPPRALWKCDAMDEEDEDSMSYLYKASRDGRVDVLQYMLTAASDDAAMTQTLTPLNLLSLTLVGAENGHLDVVKFLFEAGGRHMLVLANHDGHSCANNAAKGGHLDILQYLYQIGGKKFLMHKDKGGKSCGELAATHGHGDVLDFLREKCRIGW